MPDTKFGLNQIDKPAPLAYRRFTNAMLIVILPGTATLITGIGLSDKTTAHVLLILGYIPSLIKGIGILLGNGQYYTPLNQTIDNSSPKN